MQRSTKSKFLDNGKVKGSRWEARSVAIITCCSILDQSSSVQSPCNSSWSSCSSWAFVCCLRRRGGRRRRQRSQPSDIYAVACCAPVWFTLAPRLQGHAGERAEDGDSRNSMKADDWIYCKIRLSCFSDAARPYVRLPGLKPGTAGGPSALIYLTWGNRSQVC